ncbi:hypothetical protein [Marinitenerispora sediminis]|uniref:HEAT repeat domain-containing protein n=1 Tax=Marinitenerispora sediminis TaxID=1931232 RepID=A0A368TC65_9ACTN|nr:hypothetical protein [Marinitenerispora sediminis]RCV58169.1 hypothetical protein DEF28_00420 [Marinitenerispora sediminis]RCV61460.1 hypothetical protein DEF23_02235 [Marinitenerispora sediminis]RCV62540.1 hypothetical protein DEF24_00770 [Marinitenerispora sediminis]
MKELVHRSRRLVLRQGSGVRAVSASLAAFPPELGWSAPSSVRKADRGSWLPARVVWGEDPALHYEEDLLSDFAYVTSVGSDPERVRAVSELAEQRLPVRSVGQLLEDVDWQINDEDRAHAVLRLGAGAPLDVHDEVLECVRAALGHASPQVRMAAIWAVTYQPWPEFRTLLHEHAATEADEHLTAAIRHLLDGWKGPNQD